MILRLQSVEELELLQSRIKAKSTSIKGHMNGLREERGTSPLLAPSVAESHFPAGKDPMDASRKPQKAPRATFEHQLLGRQLTQSGIAFREEFRFEPKRRWKADFFLSNGNFLVEIVGGLWLQRSGHSHGKAQLDDMEKFNHAAKLGYRVLQFSPDQVKTGEAIGFIGLLD